MSRMKFHFLLAVLLGVVVLVSTPTEAFAVIQILNGQTGLIQTFQNDSNVTVSSLNNIHSLGWLGLLPVSRGGTGANSFTAGSVIFSNGTVFSQNNSNFFWDNTNKRLGIGTTSPTSALDVSGNAKVSSLTSTGDSTINTLTVGLGGGSVANNTAFGKDALITSTGGANTAFGFRTLVNTGSYEDSTAIGASVMANNTGTGNTAVGSGAMRENTTGGFNTVIGSDTMRLNDTGGFNTALGHQALRNNISGNNNIAIGYKSGELQAIGFNTLTSPDNSIYIGANARGFDNNDSNSIVIGDSAIGAGANTAVIGNSGLGNVYFGSSNANANTHALTLYSGSSTVPGCIVMGDTAGGVGYITLNSGVLTVSSTKPSACQ